jgi:hypothetical protein
MGKSKRELMQGIECVSARLAGNNTLEYVRADGATCFKLHNTTIVTRHADGRVTLNSGGWRTVTTKARFNELARPWRVYSDKGTWTVTNGERSVPYFDGITLPDAFDAPREQKKAARAATAEAKRRKQIAAFVKATLPIGAPVPLPNAGDCFLCAFGMDAAPVRSSGFAGCNATGAPGASTCIASHVDERYMHGSLVVRALRAKGLADAGVGYYLSRPVDAWLRSTVRRFLNRSLGLVA